jgi:hypothetical protein
VHIRVGPEISRIGGLLIATWQLLTCRWRSEDDEPVSGPWSDDDKNSITEVTEVTKASIDVTDKFEIKGKTESTAWFFERPSLMSVEPSESEAAEIRANFDPYPEDT